MTTAAEGAELTQTGPGTPMGELMRLYWMPALKSSEIEREWNKVLDYMEKLKVRVSQNPRVKYFAISRKNNDVMLRVQEPHGRSERTWLIEPCHYHFRQRHWQRAVRSRQEPLRHGRCH